MFPNVNIKNHLITVIEGYDRQTPNREQSAVVYDMLSEGEIYGLHNGLNSIHFNGTPLIDEDQWNIFKPNTWF